MKCYSLLSPHLEAFLDILRLFAVCGIVFFPLLMRSSSWYSSKLCVVNKNPYQTIKCNHAGSESVATASWLVARLWGRPAKPLVPNNHTRPPSGPYEGNQIKFKTDLNRYYLLFCVHVWVAITERAERKQSGVGLGAVHLGVCVWSQRRWKENEKASRASVKTREGKPFIFISTYTT